MLTENQKEAFRKIKEKVKPEEGGLTAKQKGDFYFRMSKILKDDLEGLNGLTTLLNELPDSYLEKINLSKVTQFAMKLTEELVKKIGPSPYAARDGEGKYHIHRFYRVDMTDKLLGLTQATASIEVIYEASEEEVQFFRRLTEHTSRLEAMYQENERPNEILTPEEMEKSVTFATKGRPYKTMVMGLVGQPNEEAEKSIMEGKPLSEVGLADIGDAQDILQKGKEEPK